ncbi:hypothetical protein GCM10010435_65840 [Winogradskya consettensis]|uniref:ScoMcrA-like N-terminal head domain-containing protein n=1 Tax=Winogradskya consettensis TaxID=113560 RepID=A0A919T387_9ACTN|nr:hypothetical protein [Actinoplanes consettensis]GIM84806.1 hypothetical protein Aco04nite_93250 [Actinoplanes consettensis]
MDLAAVTRRSVLDALAEVDRLGRRPFLKTYGFGPARTWFIDYEQRLYDSKAIMGYAHGLSVGTRLTSADFKGGEQPVARRLEILGFEVLSLANPDWTREEIILAGELVADNGWRQLEASHPDVKALSQLLQSPTIHAGRRHPDFRNPAGVARKTWNIVNHSSNGNRLDRTVFDDYQTRPGEMRREAASIAQGLRAGASLGDAVVPSNLGFDRRYRGKPAEGTYPDTQATSPQAKEAAVREHDRICRQLIAYLDRRGIPAGELVEPPVDVAWWGPTGTQMIAEVKSCVERNDTAQLRLGLGQVLEYRHRLRSTRGLTEAILLVSRIADPIWLDICRSVGVHLLAADDESSWSSVLDASAVARSPRSGA